MSDKQARRIQGRIAEINDELQQYRDFWDQGASSDVDYRVAEARMQGLRQEKEKLKEILGDL